MKKYLILAAAAVAALAACSKVKVEEAPDVKISFEVGSYSAQTKAPMSSNAELDGAFTSYAWFTNGEGTKMAFMSGETVSWNTPVTGQWAPARDYYWPKTGYVDFYSYDGTKAPTSVAEGAITYSNVTIEGTDNILVADAAYRQTQNTSTYHIDNNAVVGVPTLFRHQLAKIQFKVKLAHSPACTNTKWVVTILNETGKLSSVVAKNQGTLTLTNSYTGSTPTTQAWSNANTSASNVGWVAGSSTETISVDETPTLTLNANATESSTDPVALINLRTVMPQVLGDDVVFTLNYNVKAYMDSSTTPYIDENLKVDAAKLATLVSSITEWDMNKIITYNVVIDPVTQRIQFDPAVEDWDNSTTGTINITN